MSVTLLEKFDQVNVGDIFPITIDGFLPYLARVYQVNDSDFRYEFIQPYSTRRTGGHVSDLNGVVLFRNANAEGALKVLAGAHAYDVLNGKLPAGILEIRKEKERTHAMPLL